MKMPRRPFYPPLERRPDIFGLHWPGILNLESEEETRKRTSAVEKGVTAAFQAAVIHLGEEEARSLFRRVIRRPKRGPGKMLASDRNFRLLKEHDAAVKAGESVATLSRRLRASGTELGNTEGAIAAQIRKLIKERETRERAAAFEARRWRMATRNEPPTLLSGISRKK
jgi:hypothetical protein